MQVGADADAVVDAADAWERNRSEAVKAVKAVHSFQNLNEPWAGRLRR